MSFGCGIISVALLVAFENRERGHYFFIVLSAVILTVSCMVKITVCIMPIAYLIIKFLRVSDTKKQIRTTPLYLVLILGFTLLGELHFSTYPIYEKGKETGNPAIAWIGLGLKNEGNWESGYDYINEITALETKQEKKRMALDYIIENRREFINPQHIISKFHTNFADGTMGVKYFLPTQDDTTYFHPLSQMFGNSGKYYWITTAFCYIYMYMLYSGLFISSLVALIKRIRNKDVTSTIEICHLSFFGITLFLMLWEANSRQLYNQIPTMILGCCLSLKLLSETTKPLHKKQYPPDVQLLT